MTTVMIFGRSRFEFAKLFPEATFEGYECNIRFCYFSFRKNISVSKIEKLCSDHKIKIIVLLKK